MKPTHPRFAVACFTIFITMASAGGASAHDLWLTFTGGASARRVVVNYGHPNDRPPALADKVVDLAIIDGNERTSLVKGLSFKVVRSAPVAVSAPFVDNGHRLIAAVYDNGLWFKAPDGGYRNALRTAMPGATDSIWSRKFAKAITGAGAPFNTVLGHPLEIVPLSDPAASSPGSTLRVRVMFDGKPLAGAKLEASYNVVNVTLSDTDNEGIASVAVPGGGDYMLSVEYRKAPSSIPDFADADLFAATYSFALPRTSLRDWLTLFGF